MQWRKTNFYPFFSFHVPRSHYAHQAKLPSQTCTLSEFTSKLNSELAYVYANKMSTHQGSILWHPAAMVSCFRISWGKHFYAQESVWLDLRVMESTTLRPTTGRHLHSHAADTHAFLWPVASALWCIHSFIHQISTCGTSHIQVLFRVKTPI